MKSNSNNDSDASKKPPKQKWSVNSLDAGLLFILFKDRVYHPDSYSAAEIFRNKELPFEEKYSNKNFGGYCQTIANKVNKFERYNNGITEEFQEWVQKARQEYASLIAKLTSILPPEEDEDDATYIDSMAEDFDIDDDDWEEEGSISRLVQNAKLDTRLAPKSRKKTKKPATQEKEASSPPKGTEETRPLPKPKEKLSSTPTANKCSWPSVKEQNTPTKSLFVLHDDRIHAAWKLESFFDGDIYLSEERNKIMEDMKYDVSEYFTAKTLMSGTGINDANNVFENGLQVARTESLKLFLKNNPAARLSPDKNALIVPRVVFYLPYKVEHVMRNFDGGEEDTVPIDELNSGEWASIVLHKQKDESMVRPKIVRRSAAP